MKEELKFSFLANRFELILFENGVLRSLYYFENKTDAAAFGQKYIRGGKYRSYQVKDTLELK